MTSVGNRTKGLGFVRNNPWIQQDKSRLNSAGNENDNDADQRQTAAKPNTEKQQYTSHVTTVFNQQSIDNTQSTNIDRPIYLKGIDSNQSVDEEDSTSGVHTNSSSASSSPHLLPYGPGIVQRLRSRFLLLAETQLHKQEILDSPVKKRNGSLSHQPSIRACSQFASVEDLSEESPNHNQYRLTNQHRPDTVTQSVDHNSNISNTATSNPPTTTSKARLYVKRPNRTNPNSSTHQYSSATHNTTKSGEFPGLAARREYHSTSDLYDQKLESPDKDAVMPRPIVLSSQPQRNMNPGGHSHYKRPNQGPPAPPTPTGLMGDSQGAKSGKFTAQAAHLVSYAKEEQFKWHNNPKPIHLGKVPQETKNDEPEFMRVQRRLRPVAQTENDRDDSPQRTIVSGPTTNQLQPDYGTTVFSSSPNAPVNRINGNKPKVPIRPSDLRSPPDPTPPRNGHDQGAGAYRSGNSHNVNNNMGTTTTSTFVTSNLDRGRSPQKSANKLNHNNNNNYDSADQSPPPEEPVPPPRPYRQQRPATLNATNTATGTVPNFSQPRSVSKSFDSSVSDISDDEPTSYEVEGMNKANGTQKGNKTVTVGEVTTGLAQMGSMLKRFEVGDLAPADGYSNPKTGQDTDNSRLQEGAVPEPVVLSPTRQSLSAKYLQQNNKQSESPTKPSAVSVSSIKVQSTAVKTTLFTHGSKKEASAHNGNAQAEDMEVAAVTVLRHETGSFDSASVSSGGRGTSPLSQTQSANEDTAESAYEDSSDYEPVKVSRSSIVQQSTDTVTSTVSDSNPRESTTVTAAGDADTPPADKVYTVAVNKPLSFSQRQRDMYEKMLNLIDEEDIPEFMASLREEFTCSLEGEHGLVVGKSNLGGTPKLKRPNSPVVQFHKVPSNAYLYEEEEKVQGEWTKGQEVDHDAYRKCVNSHQPSSYITADPMNVGHPVAVNGNTGLQNYVPSQMSQPDTVLDNNDRGVTNAWKYVYGNGNGNTVGSDSASDTDAANQQRPRTGSDEKDVKFSQVENEADILF